MYNFIRAVALVFFAISMLLLIVQEFELAFGAIGLFALSAGWLTGWRDRGIAYLSGQRSHGDSE